MKALKAAHPLATACHYLSTFIFRCNFPPYYIQDHFTRIERVQMSSPFQNKSSSNDIHNNEEPMDDLQEGLLLLQEVETQMTILTSKSFDHAARTPIGSIFPPKPLLSTPSIQPHFQRPRNEQRNPHFEYQPPTTPPQSSITQQSLRTHTFPSHTLPQLCNPNENTPANISNRNLNQSLFPLPRLSNLPHTPTASSQFQKSTSVCATAATTARSQNYSTPTANSHISDSPQHNSQHHNSLMSQHLQHRLAALLQRDHGGTPGKSAATTNIMASPSPFPTTSPRSSSFFSTILSKTSNQGSLRSIRSTSHSASHPSHVAQSLYLSDDTISSSTHVINTRSIIGKSTTTDLQQRQQQQPQQQDQLDNTANISQSSQSAVEDVQIHSTTPTATVTSNGYSTTPSTSFLSLATATAQKREKLQQLEQQIADLSAELRPKQHMIHETKKLISECEKTVASLNHSQFALKLSPQEVLYTEELESERKTLEMKIQTCTQSIIDAKIIHHLLASEYTHTLEAIEQFEIDLHAKSLAYDNSELDDEVDVNQSSFPNTSPQPASVNKSYQPLPHNRNRKGYRAHTIQKVIELIQILQYELLTLKLSDVLIENKTKYHVESSYFDLPAISHSENNSSPSSPSIPTTHSVLSSRLKSSSSLKTPQQPTSTSTSTSLITPTHIQALKTVEGTLAMKQAELAKSLDELHLLESTQSDLLDQIQTLTVKLNQVQKKPRK